MFIVWLHAPPGVLTGDLQDGGGGGGVAGGVGVVGTAGERGAVVRGGGHQRQPRGGHVAHPQGLYDGGDDTQGSGRKEERVRISC